MGKKAPKAPDPAQTAAAQGAWNSFTAQQQQQMNMVGQNSPWGSLSYDQTGSSWITDPNGKRVEVPTYTANTTLSPEQQAIFDSTQSAEGNLANIARDQSKWLGDFLKGGVDLGGLPGLQGEIGGNYNTALGGLQASYAGGDDFSADRQRTEDAILQRIAPSMARDEDRLRTQLINQGIRPGSAAWDAEMNRLQSGVNDARLGAVLASGQEQSRLVGLARDAAGFNNDTLTNRFLAQNQASLGAANFNNSARSQGFSEAFAARNQPLNELLGIMSGTQVQNPNSTFAQTPQSQVAGVDYTGLVNQKYQGEMSQYNAKMGALGGLFGAGMGLFSDRRLKENIERIGQTDIGTPVYKFNYIGQKQTHIGYMAQDLLEAQPDAVHKGSDGYYRVRYDMVK